MTTRKQYTKEFKLDAVSLVTEQNYRPSEAATHLGIDARLLSRWVKESKQQADGQSFRGDGTLTAEQQQIRELKARVKRLEMERDVLKNPSSDVSNLVWTETRFGARLMALQGQ